MELASDSDLALAIALAQSDVSSSQDDDFQPSSLAHHLSICTNLPRKRPPSQKKARHSQPFVARIQVEKPGKENRRPCPARRKSVRSLDADQSLKSDNNGAPGRRQSAVGRFMPPPSQQICSDRASLLEDECLINSDGIAFEKGEPASLCEEKIQQDEVTSLADDKEALDSVVGLSQEESDFAAILTKKRKQDEVNLTSSSSRCIGDPHGANSETAQDEMNSRRQLVPSQIDTSMPSANLNSDSQFSALLRLCVDATSEDCEIREPNAHLRPSEASVLFSMEAGNSAEVEESPEELEDIMSLMTQSMNQCIVEPDPNSPDNVLLDQKEERENLKHFSPKGQGSVPLNQHVGNNEACLELPKGHEGDNSIDHSMLDQETELKIFSPKGLGNEHRATSVHKKCIDPQAELISPPVDSCRELITNEEGIAFCHQSENEQHDLLVECPVCGSCITGLSHTQREIHTNACLDRIHQDQVEAQSKSGMNEHVQAFDVTPVLRWLETLDLTRYASVFIREEIDWDTLKWLTDEDLNNLGITALGPRRKIIHSLQQFQKGVVERITENTSEIDNDGVVVNEVEADASGKKRITDFFTLHLNPGRKTMPNPPSGRNRAGGSSRVAAQKQIAQRLHGVPSWMTIPGTNFRVDAFQHLTADCSHWFLTHFHTDHYQGLTRGFRYGHVYCSSITAELVSTRIGLPRERLQTLPLNEETEIDGVKVTFLDANHCPGSVMILFEPKNGKAVLHTGDFRFCENMANSSVLHGCNIHTLMLDTTYCDAQYDFPKQDVVIQFIIDAIQAEAFNPRTLFLIGTYTIGKERIFLEVARVLQKKVYLNAAKFHLLQCMQLPSEDMQWLTTNDEESYIHVVPLWTIASFKRMGFVSRRHHGKYNTIVSFSPTGWSYGRGKKRTPGRRWQQGTIVRYEVPYSEHSSFRELQEFVKFVAPVNIVPTVHNNSPEAADAMVALLLTEEEGC